ncbi:MAG: hypothetical protein ACR2I8_01120 [Steroidobacteraceae bacterium]
MNAKPEPPSARGAASRQSPGRIREPGPPGPHDRPLRRLRAEAVRARFEQALLRGDGSDGAHCVHELWMRGEIGGSVERMLGQLWQQAAASVPDWLPMRHVAWLPVAYEVAARFQGTTRGRCSIYLVLLDFSDSSGDDPHGVYVGMTHYPPAERFDQHKAGIRAAGSVLRRGLELLAGPALHLRRLSRAEAARIEEDLAAALAAAGVRVRGGH